MPKFFAYLVEKFSLSEEISTNSILQKIQSETPNAKFGDDVSLLQIHFP
jgi:hypothetical protein